MTRTERALLVRFVSANADDDNTMNWEDVGQALAIANPTSRQIAFRVVAMRKTDGVQFWFHCTVSENGAVEATAEHDTFRSANGDTDTLTQSEIAEVLDTVKRRNLTVHEIRDERVQFDWDVGTPPHATSHVYIPSSAHLFYFLVAI